MDKHIIAGLYFIGTIGAFSAGICTAYLYRNWQESKKVLKIKKQAEEILERLNLITEEQTSEQ